MSRELFPHGRPGDTVVVTKDQAEAHRNATFKFSWHETNIDPIKWFKWNDGEDQGDGTVKFTVVERK